MNREARNRARLPAPPRALHARPPCGPTVCSGPLCGFHLPPPRPPLSSPRTEVLCSLGFRLLNQTTSAEHCLSLSPAGGSLLLFPDKRPELLQSLLPGVCVTPEAWSRGHMSVSWWPNARAASSRRPPYSNPIGCACLACVWLAVRGERSGPLTGRHGLGPVFRGRPSRPLGRSTSHDKLVSSSPESCLSIVNSLFRPKFCDSVHG